MGKTNLFLVLIGALVSLTSACSSGIPDPGFAVVTVRTNSLGIESPMPGIGVSGFTNRPAAGNAYGSRKSFGIDYSSNSGLILVHDGFAPAFWVLTEHNGPCAGQSAAGGIKRADYNYLNCTQFRISLPIAFLPFRLDAEGMPAAWTVSAPNLNADYGMPTLQFYDLNSGTLVCQMQANYISDDRTWVEGSPWNLQYVPSGTYLVQVWNPTADGVGEYVGHTTMNLYRTSELPPDADGDGFRANEDCNDEDASIYPGASTLCTPGEDRNCNYFDDYDDCYGGVCGNPDLECNIY